MEWYRPSIIFTKEDFTTTPELVEIIADSSKLAAQKILKMRKKNLPDSYSFNIFPGEHYRLLNSIVKTLNLKKL